MAPEKLTVYQKPSCGTCRRVYQALKESGVDFDTVNYYTEPLDEKRLGRLIRKMGVPARELFRSKEKVYSDLDLGNREVSDEEAVRLMVAHPDLMQRPIVEKGSRAVLARPAEKLKEIL